LKKFNRKKKQAEAAKPCMIERAYYKKAVFHFAVLEKGQFHELLHNVVQFCKLF
jgi:hypothetical protein